MEFIINNWYVILSLIVIITIVVITCIKFLKMPTDKQIKNIKEWLLFAVIKAEKEFGEKTGVAKLRFVYDLAITKFPFVASVISFETFKIWVDDALDEMKKILKENTAIEKFVNN